MDVQTWVILAVGGLVAGVVNTLAGGGSLLTVPLLVFLGLPGTVANGTNRIGVLFQNLVSIWRFRAEGVSGIRAAVPILIPVVVGSAIGAKAISELSSEAFEQVFGVVMLGLLVPMLRGAKSKKADDGEPVEQWSRATSVTVFFLIGIYGGAIQAGVGLVIIAALSHAGYDLVRANSIKVVIIASLTLVAAPVFILEDQVAWAEASALVVGFALGGEIGARLAVRGGERIIRPVLIAAVVAISGRMLGLY